LRTALVQGSMSFGSLAEVAALGALSVKPVMERSGYMTSQPGCSLRVSVVERLRSPRSQLAAANEWFAQVLCNRPPFRVQSSVMKLRTAPVFVAAFAALITLLAQAQQPAAVPGAAPGKDKAKAKGGGAPKGINWPSPPLPDSPYKFDTGVERNLTLTI